MNEALNEKYREILISPIRECATYSPKFGHGRGKGLSLTDFQALYGADYFYKWLGLDVLKYFDDMAIHIQSVYNAIQPGGTVHYIVGNSNFYGNSVPSEKLYTDILSSVGFSNAKYTVVRKRNCNKALFEYWISAKKA